jgi:hypothetical protein
MSSDHIGELAPELALGIVDGEERADALRHLSTCAECRRAVDDLAEVADELLILAPVQEPPPGFASRVAEGLALRRPPRRRRRRRRLTVRWLAPRLGSALAAAAVTAAVLVGVYHDDHETAQRYRETLAQAGGRYFQAEPLTDRSGSRGGVAFGYEGSPSWVLVTVDATHRDEVTRGELVTRDGRTVELPRLELDRNGSWGGAIPVNLYKVASIRLLGNAPGQTLEASFPRGVTEGN